MRPTVNKLYALNDAKFEVFTVMLIQVEVFRVFTLKMGEAMSSKTLIPYHNITRHHQETSTYGKTVHSQTKRGTGATENILSDVH
jgi:hypothetical protein